MQQDSLDSHRRNQFFYIFVLLIQFNFNEIQFKNIRVASKISVLEAFLTHGATTFWIFLPLMFWVFLAWFSFGELSIFPVDQCICFFL